MKRLHLFIALCLLPILSLNMKAETCSKKSPSHVTAMLELYTSEGCSSCPPADKFMRELYGITGLTTDQVIPLSLHVDYWDYIGWKDVFANPLFSKRQYWLAAANNSHGVYTPEFFLSGKESRSSVTNLISTIKSINTQSAKADIQINIVNLTDTSVEAELITNTRESAKLYYALVENNLTSHVKAGENANATLKHDHVVRTWSTEIDLAANTPSTRNISAKIPLSSPTENLSLVAFVQNNKGDVLQSLSLPLCK